MGNGDFGYRPPRFRLMNDQLHLDPEITRIIQDIEARMAARQMVNQFLQPNWQLLMPTWQSIVVRPNALTFPSAPQTPAMDYVPGQGPATVRAGELGDVTGAIYRLPAVQRLVLQAHDEGMHQLRILRGEWERATPTDRAVMVTMTGIVVGSSLTIIFANQPTRDMAFNLVKGHDIPIPGVDGLSFQILDRGGSITAPLGVPGLSGSARLQFPSAARTDYEVTITFDVMEFIRSQR
jgi:hypothetical protein